MRCLLIAAASLASDVYNDIANDTAVVCAASCAISGLQVVNTSVIRMTSVSAEALQCGVV
jgi:hypothetical protein